MVTGSVRVDRPEVDRGEAAWEAARRARPGVRRRQGLGAAPAPYRALELMAAAQTADRDTAFAAEDEALADLIMSDELRSGLYAFDLVQRAGQAARRGAGPALARPVTKVGVVGAGLMASQLALLFVRRLEVPVVITDLDQDRVDKGVGYVHAEIDKLLGKGRINADQANRLQGPGDGTTTKDEFADGDFVIEAVFEEMASRSRCLAELEAVVAELRAGDEHLLAVGDRDGGRARAPERVVGFHFFNPVAVLPLLEIVRGTATDDATIATAFAVGKTLKKTASW